LFDRELSATAAAMVARGKGILATDELRGTLEQRFGQSDDRPTADLNAMNAGGAQLPYPLSFSWGGALQAPAFKGWKGRSGSVAVAQKALFRRANLNSAACFGRYKVEIKGHTGSLKSQAACP
jgi:fructose-bisphosphate aldolase class 1